MTSTANRIRAAVRTYADEPPQDIALRLMADGFGSDDDLAWLLTNAIKVEQARHGRGLVQQMQGLPPDAMDKPKKSGVLRDPRAQRVYEDFLSNRVVVFGVSKQIRDLTYDDCIEAARVRSTTAKQFARAADRFERAAYALRTQEVERVGDLHPAIIRETLAH